MSMTSILASSTLTFLMISNHPISISLIIIYQTMLTSLLTSMLSNSPWYSYILFMIMIGGIMVTFMYMTSMIPNKKFKSNTLPLKVMMIMILMLMMFKNKNQWTMTTNSNTSTMEKTLSWKMSLSKFINFPPSMIMLTMIFYLFISMMVAIKITIKYNSPMRTY